MVGCPSVQSPSGWVPPFYLFRPQSSSTVFHFEDKGVVLTPMGSSISSKNHYLLHSLHSFLACSIRCSLFIHDDPLLHSTLLFHILYLRLNLSFGVYLILHKWLILVPPVGNTPTLHCKFWLLRNLGLNFPVIGTLGVLTIIINLKYNTPERPCGLSPIFITRTWKTI